MMQHDGKKLLSIILPIYNEESNIEEVTKEIKYYMDENDINFEIVFVDDGSTDFSWDKIDLLTQCNTNIRGIKFSRNFGKEAAIFAGLENVQGDACIIMDSDLQHPPEVIVEMYEIWIEGKVDIVSGVKVSRGKESKAYKTCSNLFYDILHKLTKINLKNASDFKLLDRKVIDNLNRMTEKETFFRAMCSWVGFNTQNVEFTVMERLSGERKWTLLKLIKYAVNGVTIYTSYPLQWITIIGAFFVIMSGMLGIQTLLNKLIGNALEGFTTVILMVALVGGCIMISLGIVGHYLALIYKEIKNRPRYIVSTQVQSKENMNKGS